MNFIHSLDGFIPRYIQKHANFETFHNHDEFKAHPNNMGALIDLNKGAFNAIMDYRPLERFLDTNLDIDYEPIRKGLKDSQYALC